MFHYAMAMAKPKKRYVCQLCGSVSPRWAGQCADCGEWNSLVEDAEGVVTPFSARHNLRGGGRRIELVGLDAEVALPARLASGIAELDRASFDRLFLFVHYVDPHLPYDPPEPWRTQYGPVPDGLRGSWEVVEAARKRRRSSGDGRRQKLTALIDRFRRGAAELDLPLSASTSAIQPLLLGSADAALTAALALERQGLLVSAIRPPTVPQGHARLRITLSAAHEEDHVDHLLSTLASCLR